MKRLIFVCAAGAAGAAVLTTSAAAEPVTPAMFGALPNVSEVEISPDGKTIAQIGADKDLRAVAFYDLTGAKPPMGVKLGNVKARTLRWAGADHVLLMVSAAETFSWGHGLETHEIFRWVSINRNTGDTAMPFRGWKSGYYRFGAGRVYSRSSAAPAEIVMGHWGTDSYTLFRVDLKNGSARVAEKGEPETVDWVVDGSARPVVRIDYDDRKEERRFYRRKGEGGRFELASKLQEKREDDATLIAFGRAEADNLVHGAMSVDGFWSLCVFDVDAGRRARCDASVPGHDVESGATEWASARVVGARYTDDFPRVRFIDAELQKIQAGLGRALPGAAPRITSWSDDRRKFVAQVDYSDHPPQFFLFDRDKRKLDMLATSYQALDGKVFAAKERYDYRTSDGLDVRGYLTVPKAASKRNMPLVVLPHGGPWARDDMSFDWWSFFYAARGYLVYQPNFRGSDGYGDAFRQAGYLQWGKKMQDDITDGVRKLVADGLVDPRRICIVGGSYGGYAALVGATLTPDLYACAVSVAGVSNIPALIAYQTDRGEVPEDAWDVRIGARVSDNETLRAVSPAYQAAKAQAPILLIHGKDDIVVPPGQSRLMRDKLKEARKVVEYVELPGEDHWLSTAATRTEMLRASIAFIDKYIGAKAN